jgi:TATA-box binding protein (TBP) (component of TFIID and TFIIIB)
MTVTGHLGVSPDLQRLYTHCAFIPYWWIGEGVIKISFEANTKGICNEDILHTTAKTKRRFFNQSSLVFRLQLPNGTYKETNIKLFKNGGFQMTGISSEEMARASITRFVELNRGRGIWSSTSTSTSASTSTSTSTYESEVGLQTFNVCMMNSDYSVGAAIRRDRLYKLLVEEYGLWSTFEPTIYQGVNTKYFWNSARPAAAPPGICVCPSQCEGDDNGHGIGHCKKITISPFRTGSVIITGAKELRQLEDAYEFLNGILEKHADSVLRTEGPVEPIRSKKQVTATSAVEILRLKKQSSPRSIVKLTVV